MHLFNFICTSSNKNVITSNNIILIIFVAYFKQQMANLIENSAGHLCQGHVTLYMEIVKWFKIIS